MIQQVDQLVHRLWLLPLRWLNKLTGWGNSQLARLALLMGGGGMVPLWLWRAEQTHGDTFYVFVAVLWLNTVRSDLKRIRRFENAVDDGVIRVSLSDWSRYMADRYFSSFFTALGILVMVPVFIIYGFDGFILLYLAYSASVHWTAEFQPPRRSAVAEGYDSVRAAMAKARRWQPIPSPVPA